MSKGSRSRVKDIVTYGANYDFIFHRDKPSTTKKIEAEMQHLVRWAKAYEEGVPIESDVAYDAQIRYLTALKKRHSSEWEEALVSYPVFKDGSWAYTGSFYHGEVV